MFKVFLILLLLGHVIGDFYIQTESMAHKKEKSLKWVLIHCFCYWCVMVLISLPLMSWKIIVGTSVAACLHLLIDGIKFAYMSDQYKKNGLKKHVFSTNTSIVTLQANEISHVKITQIFERNVFFVDLFFHGISLIGIAYWLAASNIQITEWYICKDFFEVIGLSEVFVLSWILALLLIHKPANIVIQKLLMIYKPVNNEEYITKDNNAGRFIGTVERIIMLIFLVIGEYSAIGLVLTAKSIARYDKISKERDFAEYYLLGTLVSTVIVIICSFII